MAMARALNLGRRLNLETQTTSSSSKQEGNTRVQDFGLDSLRLVDTQVPGIVQLPSSPQCQ